MLGSAFLEVSLGSFLATQLWLVWGVHFTFFRKSKSRYLNFRDKQLAKSRLLLDQEHPQAFYRLYLFSGFLGSLFFGTLDPAEGSIFFRQVCLGGLGLSALFLTSLALCLLSLSLASGSGQRASGGAGQDFFTSVWLISLVGPLALLANNLVCFFLVLEVVSAASMYMLASARGAFSSRGSGPLVSRQSANTVFLHFWSSFFSSVLFVYSIVSFLMFFGTTEWVYLDSLVLISGVAKSGPQDFSVYLAAYSLLLAVLIKLGSSPFFFFKLEIYRGLPLLPLVFYSVFYFFVFSTLFFLLLAYFVPSLLSLVSPGLSILVGVSVLFLGSGVFSLPLLRSFFGMSSALGCILTLFLLLSFFF